MPASPLRALLTGAIDYAGLFPPASLELEPALANHGRYVHDDDSWMLGTFVLPAARFEEISDSLAPFDVEHRLRISALGPKTETADEFRRRSARCRRDPRPSSRHGAIAGAVQIEIALPSRPGATIQQSATRSPTLTCRLPRGAVCDAERVIEFIAEHRNGPARRDSASSCAPGGRGRIGVSLVRADRPHTARCDQSERAGQVHARAAPSGAAISR
jgi:hypothetical protein